MHRHLNNLLHVYGTGHLAKFDTYLQPSSLMCRSLTDEEINSLQVSVDIEEGVPAVCSSMCLQPEWGLTIAALLSQNQVRTSLADDLGVELR